MIWPGKRFDWLQAFVDFEGCCALTCGVERCRAAFCFFCLEDCGTDAHGHVVRCPKNLNPGELYTKKKLHDVVHRESRKKQIVSYLQTKCRDPVLRSKVLESIAKNLAELQIEITPLEVGLNANLVQASAGNNDQTVPVIRNQVERLVPAPVARMVPEPAPRPVPAVGFNPVPAPAVLPVPAPLARPVPPVGPYHVPALLPRPVPAPLARPVPAPPARPVPPVGPYHVPAPPVRPVPAPLPRPVPAPLPRPVPAPPVRPFPAPIARPVPAPIARPVPAPAVRPVENKKNGCCIS